MVLRNDDDEAFEKLQLSLPELSLLSVPIEVSQKRLHNRKELANLAATRHPDQKVIHTVSRRENAIKVKRSSHLTLLRS